MNKFYLLHGTKSEKSLIRILKDGYLLSGQKVDKKYRFHGGEENELNEIFFNIYFDDIKNLDIVFPFTLIFKSDLLKNQDFVFNKGWGYQVAYEQFLKSDDNKIFKNKIKKIKKFLKDPNLPPTLKNNSGIFHHELHTHKKINIKKFLIGIICYTNDKKIFKKVTKFANILNVPIVNSNILPSYDTFNLAQNKN